MKSATKIFRQPKKDFHHSESRWSAIAQMAFIWMSKTDGKFLNIFKSQYKSNQKNWLKIDTKNPKLIFKSRTSLNTIVEGNISKYFDKSYNVPNLKPDLVLIDDKNIIIIEVKTVGAKLIRNLQKYIDLTKFINKNIEGYTCSLYYLMSYGHEDTKKHNDWRCLDNKTEDINIILWEDLFLNIQDSPLIDFIGELKDLDYWKRYIDNRFINV